MAWLSCKEVASLYGVSPSTVRRWADDGAPHAIDPTGCLMFKEAAVDRWVDKLESEMSDSDDELDDEDDSGDELEEDEDPDEEE